MIQMPKTRYPIGIQTFERIISEGYVYVDKTDLVWQLAHTATYTFLSRPRRFGKSLLTTTLKSYFEGRRDLFEGLKIMPLEQEWKQYPVIHLDMSTAKNKGDAENLQRYLKIMACKLAKLDPQTNIYLPGELLQGEIERLYTETGKQVVLLIDEYDAPLLEVMHEQENLGPMRKVMQEFYQPLKACEGMIKFCFLTGITKFSQLSIFSTLNNIKNVSMMPEFATICGITEGEMETRMADGIDALAEYYGCTHDEMLRMLKLRYDGYHFAEDSDGVYNPYSLINAMSDCRLKNYWFESGTPTFLFNQMLRFGTDITKMDDITAPEMAFHAPTETLTDALPLLYQAGYLTIKGYNRKSENYTLGIPNQEVRVGFTEGLLPIYSGIRSYDVRNGCAYKMWEALERGDIDQTLREMKAFLASVPYIEGFKQKLAEAATKEGFYEFTFYLILSMLNVYVQTQVKCWTGRVDAIVYAPKAIYLFEFKTREGAEAALAQINDKHYADRFATDPRRVVKVGVQFDIDTWTIGDWAVEEGCKL